MPANVIPGSIERHGWVEHRDPLKPLHTKVVRNWSGYKAKGSKDYAFSAPALPIQSQAPDNWGGAWNQNRFSRHGAAQISTGDTATAGNAARVDMRIAGTPDVWLSCMPVTDGNEPYEIIASDRAVEYADAFPGGCLWHVEAMAHGYKDTIARPVGGPEIFEFSLNPSPGCTLNLVGGRWELIDQRGNVRSHKSAPMAWDSATDGSRIDGANPIRSHWEDRGTRRIAGRDYRIAAIVLNADDVANSTGSIYIDPTDTISGTTDIEDSYIYKFSGNLNNGAGGAVNVGASSSSSRLFRGQWRIATAGAIPSGTLTGFRFYPYFARFGSLSSTPQTCTMYRCVDAADWVEGTASDANQSGSVCWNQAQYTVLDWPSATGGLVIGTDTDASSGGSYSTSGSGEADGFKEIALTTSWASDWRDGVRDLNGFHGRESTSSSNSLFRTLSSEDGSNPCYFEVDYDSGPSGQRYYFDMIARQ